MSSPYVYVQKFLNGKNKNLSFGEAFDMLHSLSTYHTSDSRCLYGMRCSKWDKENSFAKGYICIQFPDDNSKMTKPYIYIYLKNGDKVIKEPYTLSNSNLFEFDWEVVKVEDLDKATDNTEYKHIKPIKSQSANKCSEACLKRCLNECDKFNKDVKTEVKTEFLRNDNNYEDSINALFKAISTLLK